MRILLFLFLSINIIAQDSNLVSLAFNTTNDNSSKLLINLPNKKASLIELKTSRSWKFSGEAKFNSNLKNMSKIKFVKNNDSFIDSDLFLVMVGSAVALGASAAYFKLESDNYYEKYEETNDKKYLDKTNRYDVYSGVSLGVLQVNFGFLIYKFLTD